jgi:thiol-disulfide isomerase/thioredoxin
MMRAFWVVAMGAAIVLVGSGMAPSAEGTAKKAPEIKAAYWLNSKPLTLEGLRGKIVVVEFWATWCPPCRRSIPHLIELNKKYAGKGVAIVGLTDEAKEVVEPFVKEMGMTYAVGGGSNTFQEYGVRGLPTAFVIDPSGAIAWMGNPMVGLEGALEAQVKKTPPKPDEKPEGK